MCSIWSAHIFIGEEYVYLVCEIENAVRRNRAAAAMAAGDYIEDIYIIRCNWILVGSGCPGGVIAKYRSDTMGESFSCGRSPLPVVK